MNIEEVETVVDWVEYYRHQFHLPVEERGGYVILSVTRHLGVIHMPKDLAKKVLGSLREQGIMSPLLARQIRWSLIASVDYSPGYQVLDLLSRNEVCIPVVGSALMIPTSFERYTREGAYWVNPPARDQLLPLLSTVITTALAASSGRQVTGTY
ncbi:hypothetical protein [Nocardia transvalensis]|uniref:hypothetical protein n=1 Tax=Nocardia transvalensis TaxID=37333 RepID=UPI0018956BAB|nr:hypothetical protein [Nocardia transvalensis]MBF6327606.1 hypothetical protein [Nocardia transvalensis]